MAYGQGTAHVAGLLAVRGIAPETTGSRPTNAHDTDVSATSSSKILRATYLANVSTI
jgi:hypothetical protein